MWLCFRSRGFNLSYLGRARILEILDALKETGRAVRACWDSPIEADSVLVGASGYLKYLTGCAVPLDILLKDDWVPFHPEKKKCEACQQKEKLKAAVMQGDEGAFIPTPVSEGVIEALYYLFGERCKCEAEKNPEEPRRSRHSYPAGDSQMG